jgi:hypothetical protein
MIVVLVNRKSDGFGASLRMQAALRRGPPSALARRERIRPVLLFFFWKIIMFSYLFSKIILISQEN